MPCHPYLDNMIIECDLWLIEFRSEIAHSHHRDVTALNAVGSPRPLTAASGSALPGTDLGRPLDGAVRIRHCRGGADRGAPCAVFGFGGEPDLVRSPAFGPGWTRTAGGADPSGALVRTLGAGGHSHFASVRSVPLSQGKPGIWPAMPTVTENRLQSKSAKSCDCW